MSVVDSHTHLLPGRLAERVREHFGIAARTLVYPLDHGLVREQLAAEGLNEIWTLPYAHKPGVAVGLNDSTRAIANQPGPLTVVGGATVHPGDDDPAGIVRRAVEELGLRVLKLHCSVGRFAADDQGLDEVWRVVSELAIPVVVHAGHSANGQTTAEELQPIDTVARRFPEATIIIAHCAFPAVAAALDLLEAHARVYGDLTPVVSQRPTIPTDRLAAAAPKLLFGSDAPNVAVRVSDSLEALRSLPLRSEDLGAITGGTAHALLRQRGA